MYKKKFFKTTLIKITGKKQIYKNYMINFQEKYIKLLHS